MIGWALILMVLLGVGAAGAAGVMLRPAPRDPQTLCRINAAPSATTLVLIDSSDPLKPRHAKIAAAAIDAERARLGPDGRLTILILSARDPREPQTVFSKCDPGDGQDANPWFENPQTIRERWQEAYRDPLDKALASARRGRGQEASPLADAISAVARDPDLGPSVPARRLVIISDMMEHRPGVFSLYAAGADYQSFRANVPGIGPPPRLDGVSVHVVQLDRPEREDRQAQARDEFWRPYFAATGAALTWAP
jgi:hypothetical protein